MSIILPVAAEDDPVIFSPLVKVPVIVPTVKVGATASVPVSSESYTAASLNTSPPVSYTHLTLPTICSV